MPGRVLATSSSRASYRAAIVRDLSPHNATWASVLSVIEPLAFHMRELRNVPAERMPLGASCRRHLTPLCLQLVTRSYFILNFVRM